VIGFFFFWVFCVTLHWRREFIYIGVPALSLYMIIDGYGFRRSIHGLLLWYMRLGFGWEPGGISTALVMDNDKVGLMEELIASRYI